MSLRAGESIGEGKYTLHTRLGSGGQAEIWKATAHGIGGFAQTVVIKALHKDKETPLMRKQLLREAQMAALLNHPNIIQIFDIREHKGRPFLVMEYFPGIDLYALLYQNKAKGHEGLPWQLVAWVMQEICLALQYAHHLQGPDGAPLLIIHRDIKPHNVLLNHEGYTKLIDFGVARPTHAPSMTTTGAIKGTPAYMSPEQIQDDPLDQRADLYSIGVALYELLGGQRPFVQEDLFVLMYAIVHKEIPPLRERCPALPAPLYEIVDRLLQKDPDARFQQAQDVAHALGELLRTEAPDFDREALQTLLHPIMDDPPPLPSVESLIAGGVGNLATQSATQSINETPSPAQAFAETATGEFFVELGEHARHPPPTSAQSLTKGLIPRPATTQGGESAAQEGPRSRIRVLFDVVAFLLLVTAGLVYWHAGSFLSNGPTFSKEYQSDASKGLDTSPTTKTGALMRDAPRKEVYPPRPRRAQPRTRRKPLVARQGPRKAPSKRQVPSATKTPPRPTAPRPQRPGQVRVWIKPVCTVFAGGQRLGKANGLLIERLAGRKRFLCVDRSRALRFRFSLRFKAGKQSTYNHVVPMGKLFVLSFPWSAIFVPPFGKIGQTQTLLSLPVGMHTLVLYKMGKSRYRKTLRVRIKAGKTTRPKLVQWSKSGQNTKD